MRSVKIFLIAIFLVFGFSAVTYSESIDSHIGGDWLQFWFDGTDSWAEACVSCSPSSGGNSISLGDPPWTYTAALNTTLKIADAYLVGDSFYIYDNDILIGETPDVQHANLWVGDNPELTYGHSSVSWGLFELASGSHSITIQRKDSREDSGAAYFRVDPIPEPSTMLLLGSGLIGLAGYGRKRFLKR